MNSKLHEQEVILTGAVTDQTSHKSPKLKGTKLIWFDLNEERKGYQAKLSERFSAAKICSNTQGMIEEINKDDIPAVVVTNEMNYQNIKEAVEKAKSIILVFIFCGDLENV